MKSGNNAVLARRVAWELTDEELKAISGGIDGGGPKPQTDWSEDFKDTSTSGTNPTSTNNGQDGDTKTDF